VPRQLSRRAVATTGIIAVLWWVAAIIWGLLDSHRVGSEWGWTSYTPIAASEANDLIGWVLWTGATVTIGAGVILLVMLVRTRRQIGSWVVPVGLLVVAGLTSIQAYNSTLIERIYSGPGSPDEAVLIDVEDTITGPVTELLYGLAVMLTITAIVLAITAWTAPRNGPTADSRDADEPPVI